MKRLWEHRGRRALTLLENDNGWWKGSREKTVRCSRCWITQHLLFPELKQDCSPKKLKIPLFKMCWVKYAPVKGIKLWQFQQLSQLQQPIFQEVLLWLKIRKNSLTIWNSPYLNKVPKKEPKLWNLIRLPLKIAQWLIIPEPKDIWMISECHAHSYDIGWMVGFFFKNQ